jgi:hypothetical protein
MIPSGDDVSSNNHLSQEEEDGSATIKTEEKKMITVTKFINGKKTIVVVDPAAAESSLSAGGKEEQEAKDDNKKKKRRESATTNLELPDDFKELMKSPGAGKNSSSSTSGRGRRYATSGGGVAVYPKKEDDDQPEGAARATGGASYFKNGRRADPNDSASSDILNNSHNNNNNSHKKKLSKKQQMMNSYFSNSSSMNASYGSLSGDESFIIQEDEEYTDPAVAAKLERQTKLRDKRTTARNSPVRNNHSESFVIEHENVEGYADLNDQHSFPLPPPRRRRGGSSDDDDDNDNDHDNPMSPQLSPASVDKKKKKSSSSSRSPSDKSSKSARKQQPSSSQQSLIKSEDESPKTPTRRRSLKRNKKTSGDISSSSSGDFSLPMSDDDEEEKDDKSNKDRVNRKAASAAATPIPDQSFVSPTRTAVSSVSAKWSQGSSPTDSSPTLPQRFNTDVVAATTHPKSSESLSSGDFPLPLSDNIYDDEDDALAAAAAASTTTSEVGTTTPKKKKKTSSSSSKVRKNLLDILPPKVPVISTDTLESSPKEIVVTPGQLRRKSLLDLLPHKTPGRRKLADDASLMFSGDEQSPKEEEGVVVVMTPDKQQRRKSLLEILPPKTPGRRNSSSGGSGDDSSSTAFSADMESPKEEVGTPGQLRRKHLMGILPPKTPGRSKSADDASMVLSGDDELSPKEGLLVLTPGKQQRRKSFLDSVPPKTPGRRNSSSGGGDDSSTSVFSTDLESPKEDTIGTPGQRRKKLLDILPPKTPGQRKRSSGSGRNDASMVLSADVESPLTPGTIKKRSSRTILGKSKSSDVLSPTRRKKLTTDTLDSLTAKALLDSVDNNEDHHQSFHYPDFASSNPKTPTARRRSSALQVQDLVSSAGNGRRRPKVQRRSSDAILSPRHRVRTSLAPTLSTEELSGDDSFFDMEEEAIIRKTPTHGGRGKTRDAKSTAKQQKPVVPVHIKVHQDHMKEIEARIAKLERDTKKDVEAMKKNHELKKMEFKESATRSYATSVVDEEKKFKEIKESGHSLIEYLQRENQNLLDQTLSIRKDTILVNKQKNVLEAKKAQLDNNLSSIEAFVNRKVESQKKHEKSAYNCEHRYIPNHQKEIEESKRHGQLEHRMKEIYMAMVHKVANAVQRQSTDPRFTSDVLSMVLICQQEVEEIVQLRVPEEMEAWTKEVEAEVENLKKKSKGSRKGQGEDAETMIGIATAVA